jgi:hypothetical protein
VPARVSDDDQANSIVGDRFAERRPPVACPSNVARRREGCGVDAEPDQYLGGMSRREASARMTALLERRRAAALARHFRDAEAL